MMGAATRRRSRSRQLYDRARGAKDTLRNIEATGEFMVNVVTRALANG